VDVHSPLVDELLNQKLWHPVLIFGHDELRVVDGRL
jgi:hypothetical protein